MAITREQLKGAQGNNTDSPSVSFSRPAAGNLLICTVSFAELSGSKTFNMGSSGWTAVPTDGHVSSSGNVGHYMFYKIAGSSEATSVDGTLSGSDTAVRMTFAEYSKTSGGAWAIDVSNHSSGSSTTASTGTTSSTSTAEELWFGLLSVKGNGLTLGTPTNGFTVIQSGQTGSGDHENVTSRVLEKIVSATSTAGTSQSISSSKPWVGTIIAFGALTAPVNTVIPSASGTTTIASVLSTDDGTWTGSGISYTYQWQRDTFGNNTFVNIASATANTYTIVTADDGCNLRCVVTATNSVGAASANSNKLGLVGQALPPSNTSVPVVSGFSRTGQTLTTTLGVWDNLGSSPSYAYQWQDSADGLTGWANIALATSSTYVIGGGEASKYIRCEVTASNSAGGTAADSSAYGPVQAAPVNSVAPAVTGTTHFGLTLSTDNGTWSNAPTSFTYQWQRDTAGNLSFSDILGATSNHYVLDHQEVGNKVRCVVTATSDSGSTTANSNAVGLITGAAPVSTIAPIIHGKPYPGNTVFVDTGDWSADPDPTYYYQWQRVVNNVATNLNGENDNTYLITDSDLGYFLRCIVIATNGIL